MSGPILPVEGDAHTLTQPSIRERLGLGAPADGAFASSERVTMAGAGAWFAASAGLLGLLSVLVPHVPQVDEAGVLACSAAASAMALAALMGAERLPVWIFHVGCVVGTLLATAAIWAWGEESLYGPLPYLWPAVYAFSLFSLRAALAQVAFLGTMFASLLVLRNPDYDPVGAWLATMVTLLSVGLFVAVARERVSARLAALTDAARRDTLTRLLNRRGFEEAFDSELERARRTGQPLSVLVGDLDHFKSINDQHGHGAGDDALRRVGVAFSQSKRSWDSAARVGGEEFAVIAPDTDEHGAYILAERIRAAVESSFERSGPAPLSVSFGIATSPNHGETSEVLLEASDQALYAAKALGRNRTVISSLEVPGIIARDSRASDPDHVDLESLLTLAEALDVRDSGSASHCQRVGRYSELMARELGLAPASVERVRIAGILHDVGRVGVSDGCFSCEGPLSDRQWHEVRSHPEIGARMLETTEFGDIAAWIGAHHERPDGTGYPAGHSLEEVPLEGAILAVADAYEAMTAERPYRDRLDPRAASRELRRGAGHQWDERVVEAMLRVV